jgi:hypothetical protein
MDDKAPKTPESPKGRQNSEQKLHNSAATRVDSLALLKSLAEVSAVFVAFTYIGGWSYVASYYRTFGLNALELDLPLPVVCTTAVYMLFSAHWPLPAIAVLSFAWVLFVRRTKLNPHIVTVAVLVLLLIIVSAAGASHGRRRANEDMLADSSGLPDVAFSTRLTTTDQPPCVEYQTYGSTDCKLLLHSKGTYYFFTPIQDPGESLSKGGNLNVYTLADSDVTGVHILRGVE